MANLNIAFIMPCHRLICWFFALLLLASCSTDLVTPPTPTDKLSQLPSQPPVPATKPALTPAVANNPSYQHLLNADRLLQAGDNRSAQNEINLIVFNDLATEYRSKYNLLDGQIALRIGDIDHALLMLQTAQAKFLSTQDQITYYQSLSIAHLRKGNVLPGVRARISLENLLPSPAQQQENMATILDALSLLSVEDLDKQPSKYDELSGWMSLAKILKQTTPTALNVNEQTRQWRLKYPTHPATAKFLQTYLDPKAFPISTENTAAIDLNPALPPPATATIAVFLPTTGAYAAAGNAIKDGLLAAQRQAAKTASLQPTLKFYNSEDGDIADLYRQAIAEGAKQVLGPLVKEQVQALATVPDLTIPVLALNHVENLVKHNLYQFGLSPIDEAEQLVLKARSQGGQNAVVLVADTPQGHRIGHYLATAWQRNGGIVSNMLNYAPKQYDVATLLNSIPELKFDGNATKSAPTFLLSANPEFGRDLMTQLKTRPAIEPAVYAMPTVYKGYVDPIHDTELGKINFCDLPWLFAEAYRGPLSQSALQFPADNQIRLRALGIDAYNLLNQIDQLATTPYAGATGRLSLNAENRITRKLACGQFKGGTPVFAGFAE